MKSMLSQSGFGLILAVSVIRLNSSSIVLISDFLKIWAKILKIWSTSFPAYEKYVHQADFGQEEID